MKHILSVDVEDYFMVEAFRDVVSMDSWEERPSRVAASTRRLLSLFAEQGVRGTFFFVGWVAEKFPELVREACAAGHEIGCHSYWHRTIFSLDREEFRRDTKQAKDILEQIIGGPIHGYRAPSWSVTRASLWALEVLSELGFTYDSSIYPIHHDIYGLPGARRFCYTHQLANGKTMAEFPPTTIRLMGWGLPAAGGGYLRILPSWYTNYAFRQVGESDRQPVVVYVHPWEVDPEQPRIANARLRSNLRHYTNLAVMEPRLRELVRRYEFQSFRDWMSSGEVPVMPTVATHELLGASGPQEARQPA